MAEAVQVGDRVLVEPNGDAALVLFSGPVAGTDGAWLGVQFDAPNRGKHDGTHEGVRYFTCPQGRGAFVRPHKLRPGATLLQALRTKYEQGNVLSSANSADRPKPGASSGSGAPDGAPDAGMYIQGARGRRVAVELCMKERLVEEQRQLDRLTRAYLPDAGVSTVGAPGEVATEAGNITVLDLQGALFRDWAGVARLNEELPALEVLDLSRVRLSIPEAPIAGPPFAKLRTLILNDTHMTWPQVCRLQPLLPALEELHVMGCGIASLDGGVTWPTVRVVNLDGNALADWSEVEHLARWPALEALHLSGNQLACVIPPADATCWAKLRTLLLAGNALDRWSSVDALDLFPSLQETRVTGNPLVELHPSTRHEVVARISRLTMLNGAVVGRQERWNAEVRYLRRALDESRAESGASGASVDDTVVDVSGDAAARHPRLAQLLTLFGNLAPGAAPRGAAAAVGGACLADDMLRLTLTCVAASAGERAPVTKQLPRTTTVATLKQLCDRLFRVPATSMALYVRRAGAPVPEALTEEQRDLYWLGVNSGDGILIDSIKDGQR